MLKKFLRYYEADNGDNPAGAPHGVGVSASTKRASDNPPNAENKAGDNEDTLSTPLTPVQQLRQRNQWLKAVQENKRLEAEAAAEQTSVTPIGTEETTTGVKNIATAVGDKSKELAGAAQDNISRWQVPGGIGLLFGILVLLLFLVVPVNANGDTRALLIWYTLNGRTKLQGGITQQQLHDESNPGGVSYSLPATPAQVAGDAAGIAAGVGASVAGQAGTVTGTLAGIGADVNSWITSLVP